MRNYSVIFLALALLQGCSSAPAPIKPAPVPYTFKSIIPPLPGPLNQVIMPEAAFNALAPIAKAASITDLVSIQRPAFPKVYDFVWNCNLQGTNLAFDTNEYTGLIGSTNILVSLTNWAVLTQTPSALTNHATITNDGTMPCMFYKAYRLMR